MALKLPPHLSAAPRGQRPGDLALQNAAAAIQAGFPREAERLAAEVLQANAGNLPAMQLLGTALLMQGRGKDAISPLERAARRARDAATETRLASALRQAGREEEACEQLARAVKRKPPFPPAFSEFAHLLFVLGRKDEAIDILRQGLAIAPDAAELSMQLGRLYAAQGKTAQARDAFTRTVALAPANRDALVALARAFQAERDFARAAETYRRLLAATPKDAPAQIGLGICLIELGRAEEGFDQLRAASGSGPKMFGEAVSALVDAGRGRFWLRPSEAARALRGEKN